MFDKKSSWKEKESTLEKSDVLLLLVSQRLWTNKVMLLQAYAIRSQRRNKRTPSRHLMIKQYRQHNIVKIHFYW